MERLAWPVAIALVVALASSRTVADERLSRRLDWRISESISSVDGLAQDTEGFLWLASPQGLIRYDGTEMRVVDPGSHFIIPGCAQSGRVRAIRWTGGTWDFVEFDGSKVVTIPGPNGASAGEPLSAACSDDGALWTILGSTIWRKQSTTEWVKVESDPSVDRWDQLWPGLHGGVIAGAAGSFYRMDSQGNARLLAQLHKVVSCYLRVDGALIAFEWRKEGGHVVLVRDGSVRELVFRPNRPIAVIEREGTIWASFDGFLVGIRPDGTQTEIRASPSAMVGGGQLLIDREHSLWVGTPRGLVQFPEPDTAGVDPDSVAGGGRWIHRFGDELFLSTWTGAQRIRSSEGQWKLVPATESIGAICRDARGRTWTVDFESLGRIDAHGRRTKIPFEHVGSLAPCALDSSGTLWMPTLRGLLRLERNADRPTVESLPAGAEHEEDAVGSVLIDRHGQLWVGAFGRVCHSEAQSGAPRAWSCEPVHRGVFVSDLIETEGGRVWAASEGVFERDNNGNWRRLSLAANEAPSPTVNSLTPSPRGGIWLGGPGTILRVTGESLNGRMTVLERLGGWHGIPSNTARDTLELEDGTVWLLVESALLRVPPSVRVVPLPPMRVAVTSLVVEGVATPVDLEFRSSYRRNRFEVHVSAFSYRDPSLLRYRFRMNDDEPWSQPTNNSVFQFYGLGSGNYALRFAASLDGERWTESATPVRFHVDRPWFLQTWFVGLCALAAATVGWAVHRTRVARLVALERQRMRIAMDLHDAIGSGIGSIGLLAGLSSRQATDAEKRREIADQIATMATELGMSLSEIVWSLRVGSERLEALAQYLKDRGNKLFVEGEVRFITRFPATWPDATLSLPLRRNVLLIAVEALHNAAKHAKASEVQLGIEPQGSRWSLWVEDDGVGIDRDPTSGTGMGSENIKRRAEEIGATVDWSPGSAGGTRVRLLFDLRSS
ncbi:MAG: histidine kinase [Acidobacteriota bacterium]